MLSNYTNPKLESLRDLEILDTCRNEDNPDDILVQFFKEGLKGEGMWVRAEELNDDHIIGTLLNSPFQDFRIKEGNKISFIIQMNQETNEIRCLAELK